MAANTETSKWLTFSIAVVIATMSTSAAISVYFWRRKPRDIDNRVHEVQVSLKASIKNCAAERRGRIRAQQALRKALAHPKSENLELTSYPMSPIGVIQSCFSTRNGTPRQPVVVPLAKACLTFNPTRVPQASLEGLEEYSHCWIIYVFHLNTDLDKLWKHPSDSKFKAKVRVPRLEGGKKGVFATRSPHRPCPIGLTMAKVDAVQGHNVLLSGVDLVDGTPVLDIKPYLPYCDSVQEAKVPDWVKGKNLLAVASVEFSESFSDSLADCWKTMGKKSLYASPKEYQSLVKQVLSWDIRSVSQRLQPHNPISNQEQDADGEEHKNHSYLNDKLIEEFENGLKQDSLHSDHVVYNLILEGLNISYRIDEDGNVLVKKATLFSQIRNVHKSTSDDEI